MRILFVASNPGREAGLSIEAELNALQRVFGTVSGEPVTFMVRPRVILEDLPALFAETQPDVLHITAHGDHEALAITNSVGDKVSLRADALVAYLGKRMPRLVYLNACNSKELAESLVGQVGQVDLAIGSSAPIANRAAQAGAVSFYQAIVQGASVQDAHHAAKFVVSSMQASTTLHLAVRAGIDALKIVPHPTPQLIARVKRSHVLRSAERGSFDILFGISGPLRNTVQVVYFTDDGSFLGNAGNAAEDLCTVSRSAPMHGMVWADEDDLWKIGCDMRMFATGVTSDGNAYSLSSTVVQALVRHYEDAEPEIKQHIRTIAGKLIDNLHN